MEKSKSSIKYPDNLKWKGEIAMSRRSVKDLAMEIGVSRKILSDTVNGHYKGDNVIELLKAKLNPVTQ